LDEQFFMGQSRIKLPPASDFRCSGCGKLLAKSALKGNHLEIKCARCGTFNAILKRMAEQVIITDSQGIVLFANEVTELVTGYAPAEIIGRTPALWGHQMPAKFYATMWKTILQNKQSFSAQLTNRHKNGTLYEALVQISPILNTSGEVQFFVGIERPLNPSQP
jgi:PAS domain S-box-containing protein